MMQEPDKKPLNNLEEGLKGIDLDKFGDKTREMIIDLTRDPVGDAARNGLKKGVAFFKKTKAALKGDEAAKDELVDSAANAIVKTRDALERAGKATNEVIEKADKKIAERLEAREKKAKPPTP
jgi:hypothetical protein